MMGIRMVTMGIVSMMWFLPPRHAPRADLRFEKDGQLLEVVWPEQARPRS